MPHSTQALITFSVPDGRENIVISEEEADKRRGKINKKLNL